MGPRRIVQVDAAEAADIPSSLPDFYATEFSAVWAYTPSWTSRRVTLSPSNPLEIQESHNSAILSRLLQQYETTGTKMTLALVRATSTSPVDWRHVHLNCREALRDGGQGIDLDAIIQGVKSE